MAASPQGNLIASACKVVMHFKAYIKTFSSCTDRLASQSMPALECGIQGSGDKLLALLSTHSPSLSWPSLTLGDCCWLFLVIVHGHYGSKSPIKMEAVSISPVVPYITSDRSVSFTLIGKLDKASKAHSRIIWACTWSHDDCCFATASRDKRVCLVCC